MKQKLNTDSGLQGRWTRTTGYNKGNRCTTTLFLKNSNFYQFSELYIFDLRHLIYPFRKNELLK